MGLRADLDSVKKRYIYYLMDGDIVIYVGTAIKPKTRYKSHMKRAKEGKTAPVYKYIREKGIVPTLRIVSEVTSTYAEAEKFEIQHIKKHQETILNFYNNPRMKKGAKE